MATKKKIPSLNDYTKKCKFQVQFIKTQRETIHTLMVEGLINTYLTRNTAYVSTFLDEMNAVSGYVRVQAMVYWFEEIAGITVKEDGKKFHCTLSKREGDTYDKAQIVICQLAANRFWKIAPAEAKVKKLCDLDTVFNSAIVQVGRRLSLNDTSIHAVKAQIAKLEQLIVNESKEDKTQDWVNDYKVQEGLMEAEVKTEETIDDSVKEGLESMLPSDETGLSEKQIGDLEKALS